MHLQVTLGTASKHILNKTVVIMIASIVTITTIIIIMVFIIIITITVNLLVLLVLCEQLFVTRSTSSTTCWPHGATKITSDFPGHPS